MAKPPREQEHESARDAPKAGGDKREFSTEIAVVLHSLIHLWRVF